MRYRPPAFRLAALGFAGILACGCENVGPKREVLGQIEAEVATAVDANRAATEVPQDVADALLPTLRLDIPNVPEVDKDTQRFDIAVNDVPADQFFMSLVDGTPYNMVVHPEVEGSISLTLKNVTVPEVLNAARDVFGYEFNRTDYGFQVLPARLQARVYQINYLNIARSGTSSTFVSSGTLQEGPSAQPVDGNASGFDPVVQAGGGIRGQRTVVGTQISTVFPETSFWQELQLSLLAIVGGGDGRSVVVNPQGGVAVVRAIPNELREVEAFLRATQLIAQRQVILEAKVLEVELSERFQAGINWAAVAGDFSLLQTGGGTNLVNQSGLSDTAGATVALVPGMTNIAGVGATGFGGVFSAVFNGSNFSSLVELLEAQGNVQVLSSPRISTMNNQKAIIKVGVDEFFVTDVSTTTVTGTATTATPNIELTPFFSGIALDVTPQISDNGDVTLHIHPTVSQVVDQQKNITIGGVTQTLPLARSTVRESDTIVRAKNGQVVVIGGLMQNSDTDQDAKTPGLGDLPLIGAAFRHKLTVETKSELVILLRPIVIEGATQWAGALETSTNNVRRLGGELDEWDQRRGPNVGIGRPAP